jgi:hypothetical protein
MSESSKSGANFEVLLTALADRSAPSESSEGADVRAFFGFARLSPDSSRLSVFCNSGLRFDFSRSSPGGRFFSARLAFFGAGWSSEPSESDSRFDCFRWARACRSSESLESTFL